ncbi:MAG: DNA recombination protein RmuC [Ardenticatenaceae bacterium]|nr:DNA recombination protein RmuC [Ardenticatenaceae bacterium]
MGTTSLAVPIVVVLVVLTALLSAAIAWLLRSGRTAQATQDLKQKNQELLIRSEQADKMIEELRAKSQQEADRIQDLTDRAARAEATLESERKASEEKIGELKDLERRLQDTFDSLSSAALQRNTDEFLKLAREKLESHQQVAKGNLDLHKQEVGALVEPLRNALEQHKQTLDTIESARQNAYGSIEAQLQRMSADQERLQAETARLAKALRQPQVRGRWGELQLQRVVELAGLSEHCDFVQQQTHRGDDNKNLRPDMEVYLPNNRHIIIDSKVPLDAYLEALEAPEEGTRIEKLKTHAKQVRGHIEALGKKDYHKHVDGVHDFTVLFIPGEVFYYAALEHDSELLEHAFRKGIILATPTTLVALLKAVALGWREIRLAENAQKIKELGEEIYKRINTLAGHIARVGKSLDSSVGAYNDAVGSMERYLLTSARRMHEFEIGADPIEELEPIDETARRFSKPELLPSPSEPAA